MTQLIIRNIGFSFPNVHIHHAQDPKPKPKEYNIAKMEYEFPTGL